MIPSSRDTKMSLIDELGVAEWTFWDFVSVLAICFVVYRFLKKRFSPEPEPEPPKPSLPPMKKQDMTVDQLREYDGAQREDKRLLLACDGTIFDVTKKADMYGPANSEAGVARRILVRTGQIPNNLSLNGPYHVFAGRDGSRGFATFDSTANALREGYDDLSDLGAAEICEMKEWASNFRMRYMVVGKLLKPDEEPTVYGEDEKADYHSFKSS